MAATSLLRPRQKKAQGFMLVPLIDVVFLLLTFFILSSTLEPYASLMLGEGAGDQAPEAAATAPGQPDLLLAIGRGVVQIDGQSTALADIGAVLAARRSAGAERALVITRSSATVQDVVTVLDALKKAAFPSVTARSPARAAP